MNKLAVAAFLMLVVTASATDTFITSAAQDFAIPTMSRAQGKWFYEAWYANGTKSLINTWVTPDKWGTFASISDGFVSNKTSWVEAGKEIALDTGTNASAALSYNTTASFVANFTGQVRIYGWVQRALFLTGSNFSIYKNNDLLYYKILGDETNYSFDIAATTLTNAGDNLTFQLASTTVNTERFANLSVTIFQNSTVGTAAPAKNENVYWDYWGNFSLTQGNASTYYQEQTGGTFSACSVSGSFWQCTGSGQLGAPAAASNKGVVNGVAWTDPYPAARWYSPVSGTFIINGTYQCPSAGNGVNITFKKSGGTQIGWVGASCTNSSYLPFQWTTTLTGNQYLWFEADAQGSATSDSYYLVNLTYTSANAVYDLINISAWDENAPTVRKDFNLTISNATNTTTYVADYTWFNRSLSEIPSGDITISATNTGCQTGNVLSRSVNRNTFIEGVGNITLYLLCDGTTEVQQYFIVKDQFGNAISNAFVQVVKTISGTNQTIATVYTDAAGQAFFKLSSLQSYYYNVSATGYTSEVNVFTASNVQPMQIFLTSSSTLPIFNDALLSANFSIVPNVFLAYPLFSINGTFNTNTTLAYYGMNITMGNLTQLFYANYTNASGGFISSGQINRTGWAYTNVSVRAFFKLNAFPEYSVILFYSISNQSDSNASVTGIINNLNLINFPTSMKAVVAAFGSLMFAYGGFIAGGASGMGLAFIAAFGFFSYVLNFADVTLFYLLAIIGVALWSIRQGLG